MTSGERLVEVLALAAKLPAGVSLAIYNNEELLRHLAALAGAQLWGIVAIGDDGQTARTCWSVSVDLDGMRVTAALARAATAAEVESVDRWLSSDLRTKTGILRQFPPVH